MVTWMVLLLVGQAWDVEPVDTLGDVGQFASLGIDKNNVPHIAYYDVTNQVLKYAVFTGSVWNIEVVDDDGDVGQFASLALDNNDMPHISYFDATAGALKYARKTPTGWEIAIVDPGPGVGLFTSIDVDEGNIPHISYFDGVRGSLKYATILGDHWVTVEVDSGGGPTPADTVVGWFTSLRVDTIGFPHIAYYDVTNGDLKYAKATTGGWIIEKVDTLGDVGLYTALDLRNREIPYIAYYDATNMDLKFARWTGTEWIINYVIQTGDVGWDVSHVIGSSHLSYYDATNADLEYAVTNDYLTWHYEWVDTTGDVGQFTSIKLSTLGYPHIAYYDVTNGDLKYATKIIKDMLPTQITSPPDTVYLDSTYIPRAWIFNKSNVAVSCSVRCEISSVVPVYQDVKETPTMAPEDSILMEFMPWTVSASGPTVFNMRVYTMLPDDSFPNNDTITKNIQALSGPGIVESNPTPYTFSVHENEVILFFNASSVQNVELSLYDISGKKVTTLLSENTSTLKRRISLKENTSLASGLYFVRLKINGKGVETKKVLIIK